MPSSRNASCATRDEYVRYLIPKDLVQFGLIPEFIGRLPVITSLQTLDEDALSEIFARLDRSGLQRDPDETPATGPAD